MLFSFMNMPMVVFAVEVVITNQALTIPHVYQSVPYAFGMLPVRINFPNVNLNNVSIRLFMLVLKNNAPIYGIPYPIFKVSSFC